MNIDFYLFDKQDSERVTELGYQLVAAMEKDYRDSTGERLKVTPYGERINEQMRLGNSQSFKRVKTIGKKLATDQPLGKGDSFVKGSDLAKIIVYVASYDPNKYPSFARVLENEGGAFWDLYQQAKSNPKNPVADYADKVLNELNISSPTLAFDLINIAKKVQAFEEKVYNLSQRIELQNLALLKKTEENKELIGRLESIKRSFAQLEKMIAEEKDPTVKAALIDKYRSFSEKFEASKR